MGNWIFMVVLKQRSMKRNPSSLILLLLILLSCEREGNDKRRDLFFEDFHAVKISGIYNIILVQDSTSHLTISGNENINSINALVMNDTLIISDNRKLSLRPGRNTLILHFRSIGYMVTYDPVNVSGEDTIRCDQFLYDAIGEIAEVRLTVDCYNLIVVNSSNTLGFFKFKGRANYCTFFNRYGCSVFADSLFCRNAEIINDSAGDVYINASENIKAYIWGPGNIFYYGNPAIELMEQKGSGRMIPLK